jgi:glycerol-3-phosphate dehydrogenase
MTMGEVADNTDPSGILTQRQALLEKLKTAELFDMLVIGGGATGSGVALDAASRGLRVALAEKGDFASGTSSRSTKLIHGGLRYLERAVLRLDRVDFNLVRDALREREVILRIAPHLCRRIPFIVPLYRHVDMLYFLAGVKLYDLVAGSMGIGASRIVSSAEVIRRFPMLRREGLRGGVMYYDGQFDDARMNIALALTAALHGAAVANYLEVVELVKENGKVVGARVTDSLSGLSWGIRARCIVNACGPATDSLRRLDNPDASPLLQPSVGSHIVLPGRLTPEETAITVPRTSDGRVLFVLPWNGKTLVGTTDRPASAGDDPGPVEEDVRYLLGHLDSYFDLGGEPVPILAAWAGLRPLVQDSSLSGTARLHRDHLIECSPSGLITITGGKWTTYRKMAQDTVDTAIRLAGLSPVRECMTDRLMLAGAERIIKAPPSPIPHAAFLETEESAHLQRSYGDRAGDVAALCTGDMGERLAAEYPFLKGEVLYAVRYEFAVKPLDFLARRIALAIMDTAAARAAAPPVVELMARELGWDKERLRLEQQELNAYFGDNSCHRIVRMVDFS